MNNSTLLTKYALLLLIATVATSPIQCASSRFKPWVAAIAVSTGIAVPAIVLPQMLPGILRYREELKRQADIGRAMEIVERSLDKHQKCSITFKEYSKLDVVNETIWIHGNWLSWEVIVPDDVQPRNDIYYPNVSNSICGSVKDVRVCDSSSQCVDLESIRHADHMRDLLAKASRTNRLYQEQTQKKKQKNIG